MHHHSPGFLKIVADVKTRVREISIDQTRAWLLQNSKLVLLDIREDHEWDAGHAAEAIHLGKGILERDLEKMIPDATTEIIMYCGGGYRSVLACEAAQKMGYRSVHSLIGGYKAMKEAGWAMAEVEE
jgi:rhodanese-related sulfurtransferase